MEKQLHFSVTGEFITHFAREQFWAETRDYEFVMKLLLNCMIGSNQLYSELVDFAHQVLIGKRQFVGDTRDDTFGLIDDDTNVFQLYPYGLSRLRSQSILDDFSKYLKDAKYFDFDLLSAYTDKDKSAFISAGVRKKPKIDLAALADSDYGWLSPQGDWNPVDFGGHGKFAFEYISEHLGGRKTIQEYFKGEYVDAWEKAGDVLKGFGWVSLNNNYMGDVELELGSTQSLTKKQADFLFTYFASRNRFGDANKVIELMND